MVRRLIALPLLVALVGCQALYESEGEGPNFEDGDGGNGGGQEANSGGAGIGQGAGSPSSADPGAFGPDDNGDDEPPPEACAASGFGAAPSAGNLAGAMFAVASLKDGNWPNNVDSSLFALQDFYAYFTIEESAQTSTAVHGRLTEVVDPSGNTPRSVLQLFVTPQNLELSGAPKAVDLVVVVDTSSSMRNDLGIASDVLQHLASQVRAQDSFEIVEWGAKAELFVSDAANPADRAEAFAAKLDALKTAQLGPGGSLGPVTEVVSTVIEGRANPHIVVVTDGGLVADSESFATIAAWRTQSAPVSFIEVQGVEAQRTYHAGKLRNLAASGNGIVMYATPSTVSNVAAHFDRLRPEYRDLTLAMSTSTLSPLAYTDAAGTDSSSTGEFLGWNRPFFLSMPVVVCDPVSTGSHTIEISGDGDFLTTAQTLVLANSPDLYMRQVAIIDRVHEMLVAGCDDASLIADISALKSELAQLGGNEAGFSELAQVLTRMDDLARSECLIAEP